MKRRQITAEITGFTPVPDSISKKHGPVTAHIFGIIWRFSQMEDEVCRASLDRIGQDVGVSGRTVQNHIKILEEDGYIKDLTPDRRNSPHEYVDTGKIVMKMFAGMVEQVGKNFQPRSEKTSIEESTTNNPYRIYEANIGPLTPMIADSIDDIVKTYSLEWFVDVVGLAVRRNARNLAYMETILKRWQAEGKDDGKSKPEKTPEEEYEEKRTAALKAQGYDV